MDSHHATRRRLTTGTILLLSIIAGAAVIAFLDDIRRLTADRYEIVVALPDGHSLRQGGDVRVAGQPVGRVLEVELPDGRTSEPAGVMATVELPADVRPHVRRQSRVRLAHEGFGAAGHIEIEPGPRDSPPLQPGDTLVAAPSTDTDRLARRARTLLAEWDTLDAVLAAVRARAAETAPERTVEAMDAAGAELGALSERYRAGPLAAMARETGWRTSIARLPRIAEAVREGFGGAADRDIATPVGSVIASGRAVGATLRRVISRADSLRARFARLEERMRVSGGLPGRLAGDTALQAAFRGLRAQLDSLVAEARANPLRFVF